MTASIAEPGLTTKYRVRFDESGPDGLLPVSGFLRYAQDLAWLHSAEEGLDREWYANRRLTWLIRAIEIDVAGSAAYGEELQASTEVLGFRRASARRRSEFRGSGGERPLAVALIDWVLLNAAGRPVRVPAELVERFASAARGTFSPLRVVAPPAPSVATRSVFTVRRSELDPMAHVNNAAYLDYVDEQLALARGPAASLPRRYRLEYVRPAGEGEHLAATTWPDESAWWCRLESADGHEVLRAAVETEPTDWVRG
ncbi:MAG TPA: acyl-ACP thioesterase domain-containing protein [Candidatus Limnocylindria bacterium]|nr:acyl-ACP thioesterase domain-containing protein [Candidatus Limnocylindria bacterium]